MFVPSVISKSEAASKTSTYAVVANFVELSPALCVVATELLGIVTPVESKDISNPWFKAAVVIWFAVPVIAKDWVFKLTSPVPLVPEKSKSLAASKVST